MQQYIDEKNEEESRAKTPRKPAKNTGTATSTLTPQE